MARRLSTKQTVIWHGKAAEATIRRAVAPILNRVGVAMQKDVKELISQPYPPASEWGAPPARRTGLLRSSVLMKPATPDDLSVEVGYDHTPPYALALELMAGEGGQLNRPHLRPALFRSVLRVRREFHKKGFQVRAG